MQSADKTILLAGATGYIGRAVARALVDAGYRVIAIVRSGAEAPQGCVVLEVDAIESGTLQRGLADERIDAVISCVASKSGAPADAWHVEYAINQQLLAAAKAVDARQFVLLSAICVQRPKLVFSRPNLRLRPSCVTAVSRLPSCAQPRFSNPCPGRFKRLQRGKPFLLFGDGTQTACKPIAESDLATFMVECLTDPAKRDRICPSAGRVMQLRRANKVNCCLSCWGKHPNFGRCPRPCLPRSVRCSIRWPGFSPVWRPKPSSPALGTIMRPSHAGVE